MGSTRKRFMFGAVLGLLAQPVFAVESTMTGDAAKGEAIVTKTCLACHGLDGNSIAPVFPKLAGQWPEYIVKQLQDFKKKKRQADPMAPIVADLSPDDFPDIAVYLAGKKPTPGIVKESALLEPGKKLFDDGNPGTGVPACAGCHGLDGKGTDRFPALSGQFSDYVIAQLKLFATGERKNDKKVMRAVADRLSEDEMKAVAEYIASLP